MAERSEKCGRVAASTSMILIGSYLFLVVEVVANHTARFASHNTSQTHVTYCLWILLLFVPFPRSCIHSSFLPLLLCFKFHSIDLDRVFIRRFIRFFRYAFAVCSFAISCAVVSSTYNFDCCLLRGKKYILYHLCSNFGTYFKVLVPVTGDIFYTHWKTMAIIVILPPSLQASVTWKLKS